MRQNMLAGTYRILDTALRTYKPTVLVACYSGGYDSMVMLHVVVQWARQHAHSANLVTVAVDTLLSADGWRKFVTTSAKELGARHFAIWDNPDLDLWRNDVETRGFVYRKAQHPFYFYYLKQRVFRMVLAHYKKHRYDKVMFLNGIRRAESADRRNAPEVEVRGSGVYVNPVLYWSNGDVHRYHLQHGLPVNPFYDRTHNSGDCLCNWHNRISMDELRRYGTKAASVIEPLHQHNIEQFGYGYDSEPSQSAKQEAAGQLRLFDWDTDCTPNLCAGCSKPEPTNDALDFVTLQRMDW